MTNRLSADQQRNFGPAAHIISCERYLKILRSLSHRTEDNWNHVTVGRLTVFNAPAEKLQDLQIALAQTGIQGQKLAMTRGALLSVDDIKMRARSPQAGDMGLLRGYSSGHSKGPVMIASVNKDTGMFVGGKYVLIGKNVIEVAKEVTTISISPISQSLTELNLNGDTIAVDRGLYTSAYADAVIRQNGDLVGTVRSSDFPIQVVKKLPPVEATAVVAPSGAAAGPQQPVVVVQATGARAVYVVKAPLGDGKFLYRFALRTGAGRVIHMATTAKHLSDNNWIMEMSAIAKHHLRCFLENAPPPPPQQQQDGEEKEVEDLPQLKCTRKAGVHEEDSECMSNFLSVRRLLTQFQGDAAWFLLRCFRFTSLVGGVVLAEYFRRVDVNGFDGATVSQLRCIGHFPELNENVETALPDMSNFVKGGSCTLDSVKKAAVARLIYGYASISWKDEHAEKREQLKQILLTWQPTMNPADFLPNMLFSRWFLQPLTQLNKQAQAAGLRNQPHIVAGTMDFLWQHGGGGCRVGSADSQVSVKIEPFYTRAVGLIADADHPSIATSVDSLLDMKITWIGQEQPVVAGQEQASEHVVAAVEVKTRTTIITVAAANERAHVPNGADATRSGPLRVCNFCGTDPVRDAEEYASAIPFKEERRQVRN
jgi:hypothetical protein